MKKTFVFLVVTLLVGIVAYAQSEASVLKQADQMIAQRHYASAFTMLEEFDPANDRPAVLLKKEDIALNYFVQSINHMAFSLQDLKPGEDLDSIRANFETGSMVAFMADSLLKRLIARNPDDCQLLCGYAQYYYALLYDYNTDLWLAYVDSACLALLCHASALVCPCHKAAYQVGLYYNIDGQDDSAALYYRRAIALCDTDWNTHYNLGSVLYSQGHYAEAVSHFRAAYYGYPSSDMKADAARALGIIYSDHLNNPDSAGRYILAAHELSPGDFGNAANLLLYYLEQNDIRANALIDTCWRNAIDGDQSYRDAMHLVNICLANNATDRITLFLQNKTTQAQSDYEHGLCHYLLGMNIFEEESLAVQHLEKAIYFFTLDGAPDEFLAQIFQVIEELKRPCPDK